ncbi:MAG: hypothetical protein WCB53_16290 [Terriglobales bacterium]
MKRLDQATKDRFLKLLLRSIPFFSAGPELYDVMVSLRRSQDDFERQVSEAVAALQNTSQLVSRLQHGVENRMEELKRLRQEHQTYSELAQIEAKKAEVLLRQVEITLGREQVKERWIAFAMHLGFGLLFFVLGVLVSDPFKAWVTGLWGRLFH